MSMVASPKPTGGGYAVAKAQGKCHICAAEIAPDQKLMAALREMPAGLERLDICLNCWGGFDRAGVLGFWQTTMPHPTAKKKIFVDDEVLGELFERLADTQEPAKLSFRFVLGLVLMRKRRLTYETSRVEGDKEIWTVRFRGRDQKLDLLNPRLDERQITDVSTQLGEILNADL